MCYISVKAYVDSFGLQQIPKIHALGKKHTTLINPPREERSVKQTFFKKNLTHERVICSRFSDLFSTTDF